MRPKSVETYLFFSEPIFISLVKCFIFLFFVNIYLFNVFEIPDIFERNKYPLSIGLEIESEHVDGRTIFNFVKYCIKLASSYLEGWFLMLSFLDRYH